MDKTKIKLVAFDLDGTLTQHKSKLSEENRAVLCKLSEKYRLLMVGAGTCRRIFDQMEHFPIDIIGNYGMQYAKYDANAKDLSIVRDVQSPVDRDAVDATVTKLRLRYGYTEYKGENVEYHPSGCLTFPLLGTEAAIEDKLIFDPKREKRRVMYAEVTELFPDYTVYIGGSSSFDFSEKKYNKYDAILAYAEREGYAKDEILYVGDDFGDGGGDSHVRLGGLDYIEITDYRTLPERLAYLL